MDQDAVGDLARDLEHPLADRGQPDRRRPVTLRARPERRRHQRVGRERAVEVERFAGRPGLPDRPEAEHVLAHPRGGVRPRRAESALDVRPDLGAEAEHEPALGQALEVPAGVGGLHHAPREGDRDPGTELDPRRGPGRKRQRQERVVVGLGREDAVDAQRLGSRRPRRGVGQRDTADRHVDLRAETVPDPLDVCGVDHRRRIVAGRGAGRGAWVEARRAAEGDRAALPGWAVGKLATVPRVLKARHGSPSSTGSRPCR